MAVVCNPMAKFSSNFSGGDFAAKLLLHNLVAENMAPAGAVPRRLQFQGLAASLPAPDCTQP